MLVSVHYRVGSLLLILNEFKWIKELFLWNLKNFLRMSLLCHLLDVLSELSNRSVRFFIQDPVKFVSILQMKILLLSWSPMAFCKMYARKETIV